MTTEPAPGQATITTAPGRRQSRPKAGKQEQGPVAAEAQEIVAAKAPGSVAAKAQGSVPGKALEKPGMRPVPSALSSGSGSGGDRVAKTPSKFQKPHPIVLAVGWCLCFCAGMVNVISFLELDLFVSHVSGTVSKVGIRLKGVATGHRTADQLLTALGLLCSFIFGASLCGIFAGRSALNEIHVGKTLYGFAMLGNSALLLISIALSYVSTVAAACCAAAACGLQNGMCTMHFGAIVRTTHVTGLSTDLGTHLGRWVACLARSRFFTSMDAFDRAEREVVTKKLQVYLLLGFGFLFGSYFGAWLADWLKIQALWIPAGITFSLGVLYLCFRQPLTYRLTGRTEKETKAESEATRKVCRLLDRAQSYIEEASQSAPTDMEIQHLSTMMHIIDDELRRRFPAPSTLLSL